MTWHRRWEESASGKSSRRALLPLITLPWWPWRFATSSRHSTTHFRGVSARKSGTSRASTAVWSRPTSQITNFSHQLSCISCKALANLHFLIFIDVTTFEIAEKTFWSKRTRFTMELENPTGSWCSVWYSPGLASAEYWLREWKARERLLTSSPSFLTSWWSFCL